MDDEDKDVSSTTPAFDEPAKDEEPSPENENVPDEKEETPAVEDIPTEKTESEEKSEETTSKGRIRLVRRVNARFTTNAVN